MSLDGFIAHTKDEHIDWTSKEDKAHFVRLTKQMGAVIMGNNTYKMYDNPEQPMAERFVVVMSRDDYEDKQNVIFRKDDPQSVLNELAKRGYEEVALIGGGHVNASFLEAGLVDELSITITPHIFGEGVPLFAGNVEAELELLDSKPLGPGEILNHYRVKS
jgi:dihydrofolate reductase